MAWVTSVWKTWVDEQQAMLTFWGLVAMAMITGKMQALKALAEQLCPGRAVTDIKLHFPVMGISTATVEFYLKEADIPAVIEAAKDCQVVEQ